MLISIILLLASFLILYLGAELALSGSEKIGRSLGLSPLAIGMLLVGLGTSLPEFFVSHLACIRDVPDLAIGNIIGSNIANLFLILGIAGFFMPLCMNDGNTPFQLLSHLVLSILLIIVFIYSTIDYISLVVLVSFFLFFLYSIYIYRKRNSHEDGYQRFRLNGSEKIKSLVKIILGFASLYYGGEVLVKAGTDICFSLNVPTYILSVILVAFGTSFPELATSLLALYKKRDSGLIVGNIIGSNIFNVSFILGTLGIYKVDVSKPLWVELGSIIVGAFFLLVLSRFKLKFSKVTSLIFITAYGILVVYWVKQI